MSQTQQHIPYQTNYTNPNLSTGANLNLPTGSYGAKGNPIPIPPTNIVGIRTPKWKMALNKGTTMLKDAWKKYVKDKQVISKEDLRTTAKTNFRMNLVNKTLAGPENKANTQNFAINRSKLNPKHGLLPNSFLGGAYGGAGSYKV